MPVRLEEVRGQFRSVFGSDPYPAIRARLLTKVCGQYQHIQAANNYRIQEVSYGAVWQAVARGGIDLETLTVVLLFNVASASPVMLFVHISSFCRTMTT